MKKSAKTKPDNRERYFMAFVTDDQHAEINANGGETVKRNDGKGYFRILPGGEREDGKWAHKAEHVQ